MGAVHSKAPLSLLQRKVANVLLLNAFDELPDEGVERHEIAIGDLARVCGFDSNNWEYLQDALRALTDVKIEWSVFDEDGKKRWGRSAYLAEVEMVERSGVATYVYPPRIRRELANPEVYARINLTVQARFGSGYALALYENCVRYRKVGTTGFHPIEHWRAVLGVEDNQYVEYKYFNKQVLKRAIAEVNRYSDIRVAMETKRRSRRVVSLRFAVEEAPAHEREPLDPEVAPLIREAIGEIPDPRSLAPEPAEVIGDHPLAELQRQLLSFGLTEAQALDLSTEFSEERVRTNLDHVRAEAARGKVKNLPAFTVSAIREDFSGSTARGKSRRPRGTAAQAAAREQAAAEAARTRESAERAERLDAAWEGLSAAERTTIEAEVEARLADEFDYAARERERDPESVVVASTLRLLRHEAMERRGH